MEHGLPVAAESRDGSYGYFRVIEGSATLILEVASLDTGPALEWRGPGIPGLHSVGSAGLPDDFWTQWQANFALFPQGVDIVFTCASEVLGLPRTTRVRRLEEM